MGSHLFRYEQLPDATQWIRLLRLGEARYGDIRCQLIETTLNKATNLDYTAVSYRWGSGIRDHLIWINGYEFPVSRNVFNMLDSLRKAEHRHLWFNQTYLDVWIDAICINQEPKDKKDKEKSFQIARMKEIYTNAEHVIVWLGKATKESDLVMNALTDLKYEMKRKVPPPDSPDWDVSWQKVKASTLSRIGSNELSQSLAALLSDSWFRRVWVLQEVGNAQAAFVLCGDKSVTTRYFAMSPMLMKVTPVPHCQAVLELMPSQIRKKTDNADLYSLLRRFRAAEATEQKDRIFALLGLCSEAGYGSFEPNDEKPLNEIIRNVISYMCFCNIDSVPEALCNYRSIDGFLSELDSLDTRLLEHLIRSSDYSSIQVFLGRRKQHTKMTRPTLNALVQRHSGVIELMDLIFKSLAQDFDIPDETLIYIVKSERGRDSMRALMSNCDGRVQLTEAVILAAADNQGSGLDILKEIRPRPEAELTIMGDTAMHLWRHVLQGQDIIRFLYKTRKVQLHVTSDQLNRIKEDESQSETLRALLYARQARGTDTDGFTARSDDVFREALDTGHLNIIHAEENAGNSSSSDKVPNRLAQAVLAQDSGAIAILADEGKVPKLHENIELLPGLLAAETGDVQLLSKLLGDGAYMEFQNEWGESLLSLASRRGHAAAVEFLCAKGAMLGSKSLFGWTPLHLAAGLRHTPVVEILLKFGADIEARSMFGWTPLIVASSAGSLSVIRVLLSNGADINATTD